MQPAFALSETSSEASSSQSGKTPAEIAMERDLLYAYEVVNGRGYTTKPMSREDRAKRLRGLKRHLLTTRCGNEAAKLAADLAVYRTVNGPSRLKRIWDQREAGREVAIIH